VLVLVAAGLIGAGLGLFYFGGLYWQLRTLGRFRRPKTAFFAGYLVRLAVALAVFYAVLRLGLPAFAAAFIAFILVRVVLIRRLGPPAVPSGGPRWK
jgi:F1F0 ATPase subunit 2